MLGQLLGEGKIKEAERSYRHLFALSSGAAVIAAFSLWAGNEPFVIRWVGTQNFGSPALSFALALNLIVNTWVLPNRAALSSALIVRPQTLSRVIEALINLGLSVLLAYYLDLTGIALGTAIAGMMTSCWYLPLLTTRLFRRSLFSFVRADALPILTVAVCVLPVAVVMQSAGVWIGGFLGAVIAAGLTALAGFSLLWRIALDDQLRDSMKGAASRAFLDLGHTISGLRAAPKRAQTQTSSIG
jgi:Na+-driven multidrug efflux pump